MINKRIKRKKREKKGKKATLWERGIGDCETSKKCNGRQTSHMEPMDGACLAESDGPFFLVEVVTN
jgi:hypothetical protein